MLRHRARYLLRLLRWSDFWLVSFVFVAAAWQAHGSEFLEQSLADALALWPVAAAACLTWPIALDRVGVYRSQRRRNIAQILGGLLAASIAPVVATALAAALIPAPFGPRFAFVCGAAQLSALMLVRAVVFTGLRSVRRSGWNTRYAVIVGSGPRALGVSRRVLDHPEWGLSIVAYIDESGSPLVPEIPSSKVHKPSDLERICSEHVVDEVIVACPRSALVCVGEIAAFCATIGVPLTVLPDLFGDSLPPPRVGRLGRALTLTFAPVQHGWLELAIKRTIDIVGAGLGLVLATPVIGAAALAVRLDSRGPVFFRQVRCGLRGRPFRMLKLRTMCDGAEARQAELAELNEMDGPVFKVREDPRVTRVGRFLRRFSLDELPQLWNVLRGEMSLVGPRPPVPGEVSLYDPGHRRRLSMRPGLTCTWQVSGRNGISFDEWMKLDLDYIDRWSLGRDAMLILRTFPAVLGGRGAS